jgi:hypothetical protein
VGLFLRVRRQVGKDSCRPLRLRSGQALRDSEGILWLNPALKCRATFSRRSAARWGDAAYANLLHPNRVQPLPTWTEL